MTFRILLDDEEVTAGSTLTGSIEIETGLELMQIQRMAMIVTFKGEEATRVLHKKTKESTFSSHELYSTSETLSQVRRKPDERNYKAPFTITVPHLLPPTIDIPWSHVEYRVGYVLLNSEEDNSDHDTPVTILSRKISYPVARPYYRKPFVELLKKNRFRKGNIAVSARVDETNLEPGERTGVSVSIRNHSPFKIKKVKGEIKQKIRARSGQNKRECDEILSSYEFKEFRQLKRSWRNCMKKVNYEEEFMNMEKEIESDEYVGKLRIPGNAPMSYTGTLLDVQYYFNVTIQTTLEDDINFDMTPIVVTRKRPLNKKEVDEQVEQAVNKSNDKLVQEDEEKTDVLTSESKESIKRTIGKLRGGLVKEKINEEVEQSSKDTRKGDTNLHGRDDEWKEMKSEKKQRSINEGDKEIRRRKSKKKNRRTANDNMEGNYGKIVEDLSEENMNPDKEAIKTIEKVEDAKATRENAESKERKKKKKRRKKKRRKSTDASTNFDRERKMKKEVSIEEVLDFLEELHIDEGSSH